jgi:hypothetical protein
MTGMVGMLVLVLIDERGAEEIQIGKRDACGLSAGGRHGS